MEEVKEFPKVGKTESKKENSKTVEKLPYEQLESIAHQLSAQNRELSGKLEQAMQLNFFKRLDYLFKVLEHQSCFSHEFINSCADELVAAITPQEEEPVGEEK